MSLSPLSILWGAGGVFCPIATSVVLGSVVAPASGSVASGTSSVPLLGPASSTMRTGYLRSIR